jgi:hypothetical protein
MGLLDEALAFIDARKREAANSMGLLSSNPAAFGSRVLEDVAGAARNQLQASDKMGSVIPSEQQAGLAQMVPGLLGMGGLNMTVYHGSPHTFDKFDMSKIGTGEGAQAYGHGLYFAESPGVAKSYQHGLSDWMPNGVEPKDEIQKRAAAWVAEAIDSQTHHPIPTAIKNIKNQIDPGPTQDAMLQAIGKWSQDGVQWKRGNLYKVDIPDEHIAKMLDWDKPLSQQPEVWNRLKANGFYPFQGADAGHVYAPKNMEQVNALREAGIPGIKYLDEGSRPKSMNWEIVPPSETVSGEWMVKQIPNGNVAYRGKSEQAARAAFDKVKPPPATHNFVVFDDKLPKILGRE